MKTKKLVAALALALGASSAAQAGVIFDPDGNGTVAGNIDLGQFDWGTTSAVARGGNTAIGAFIAAQTAGPGSTPVACGAACNFDVLTHAALVATKNQSGAFNTPPGLNASYEITMVARFQEVVTSATTPAPGGGGPGTGTATFNTTGVGLIEIYFDSSPDATDLSGHGFNDGRLILQGNLAQSGVFGSFTVFNATPVQFDKALGNVSGASTDNYGDGTCPTGAATGTNTSQCSTQGTGSQGDIAVGGLVTDPEFFKTVLQSFGLTYTNISQQIPFTSVNPSDCFTPLAAAGTVGTDTVGAQPCVNLHNDTLYIGQASDGGYLPIPGPINGLFTSGPDFVFQTDFNATVAPAAVPEPGSLALLGLGLGALGFGAFKRRRRTLG